MRLAHLLALAAVLSPGTAPAGGALGLGGTLFTGFSASGFPLVQRAA